MSQAVLHRPTEPAPAAAPRASVFRADVEGLRAVAVLLVVGFHVGISGLSGGYVGVDVFFVISGFLITSQLLRELVERRSLSITRFYARRMTRLLPAATLTIAATLAAAWFWLPPIRFRSIAIDALSAAGYGINWRLAGQGTDYLAADAAPSPLQHFWSLAVEEQFYLVWPVLLFAASLVWWRRRSLSRIAVAAVLILVIAGSLALSIWQTGQSAPWAYFGAHTRVWELAVGALVAVAIGWCKRLPRPAAVTIRWVGITAIVVAGVYFTEATAFPGYAAALPVGGAALVIAAGPVHPGRLLGIFPLRALGGLSYSWYLWHWPVLMIAPYVLGYAPNLWQRLALAAGALLIAVFSYVWVEDLIRGMRVLRVRPWKAIRLGVGLSGAIAALAALSLLVPPPTVGTGHAVDAQAELASTPAVERALTRTIEGSAVTKDMPANLVPALDRAADDLPTPVRDGCNLSLAQTKTEKPCVYGSPRSATEVVLFGDSHAEHWFPAVDKVATERGWRLHNFTKDACSAASVRIFHSTLRRPYDECVQWRTDTFAAIRKLHPALVVMSSNGDGGIPLDVPGDVDAAWVQAWLATVRELKAHGTTIVMLEDTAWPKGVVPDCLSLHLSEVDACGRRRAEAVAAPTRRRLVANAVEAEGVTVLDPLPWLCTDQICPAVVGNVLVYRDGSHLTATYAALLGSVLATRLPTRFPSA